MLGIGEFFKKIQNVRMREMLIRSTAQEVIKNQTSVEVPIDAISFKSGTMLLNVNQTARSVIYIKRQGIMEEINSKQKVRTVTDIR